MRIVLGIVAGIAAILLTVMGVEAIGHQLYPFPADVNLMDPEQVGAAMPRVPLGAKLFVVGAWFAAALIGGVIAGRIIRRGWAPWTIAGLVVVAALANVLVIPHPVWMQISAVLAPLLGGMIARHLTPVVVPVREEKAAGDAL